MAAHPGEDLAATLFADVHYFYGSPAAKPPHHRFDKGSYVYLFENASQRRARIEVANNAGTAEQDAFTGHLDAAHVQYSYKHSTLVTLTVDGSHAQRHSPIDHNHDWHLPTFDPRNENKYMYKLHTLDIYFWMKEDAILFINSIRRVLPQQQITVQDEPIAPPPHPEDMSPVVQKLENIAVSDPSYQQGRTRDSRTTTASSGGGFPGPPISATPQSIEAVNFVPMAYNPAAPPAPETIRHREKTPPPEDGASNPLTAAAVSDQGQSFGNPYGQHGFSGPPQQQQHVQQQQQSYFTHPPPPASMPPMTTQQQYPNQSPQNVQSPYAQHFQNSFAPPPTTATGGNPYAQPPPAQVLSPPPSAPPYQNQQQAQQQQQQHSNLPVTQFASYPLSPGISPSKSTPSTSIYSPGMPGDTRTPITGPPAPAPHVAPPGGFSQHQYTSTGNTAPLMTDYSIHQQVYRPTESEAYKPPKKEARAPRGNLEKRAGQLEKGLGGIWKRVEKKIG
ncbi:hypothetical protein WAI453_000806 [Rhynchosporium graminicola]|uniref:Related to hydroxyproline-rich glycoprotein n=1 Tax=Rhynchosporium graminicola TaxID=2792576 RepID=A0A1E1K4V2_9HELO|nr:related to hydroxyproline-rich glycoprotein precursor [Rhynchosporium commune]